MSKYVLVNTKAKASRVIIKEGSNVLIYQDGDIIEERGSNSELTAQAYINYLLLYHIENGYIRQ